MLVLGDVDLLDDPGNIGRNADLVGFDVGVIRRHDLAAGDVPIAAGNQRKRKQNEQGPAHQGPPGGAVRFLRLWKAFRPRVPAAL